ELRHAIQMSDPIHFTTRFIAHTAIIDNGAACAGVISGPPPFTLIVFADALGCGDLRARGTDYARAVTATICLVIEARHREVNMTHAGLVGVREIRQDRG